MAGGPGGRRGFIAFLAVCSFVVILLASTGGDSVRTRASEPEPRPSEATSPAPRHGGGPNLDGTLSPVPLPPSSENPIDHVVFLIKENRTFNMYFGSYPGATGSLNHEVQDARQFAAWGVDYLKYDWCSPTGTIDDQVRTFAKMRDALAATGRPILYSINSNSIHEKTGPQRNWGDVANMWRTTEDISDAWDTGQANG